MKPTFKKSERLTSRSDISAIFHNGEEIFEYPFKIKYKIGIDIPFTRILISVPKRNFKNATDRNLIKRRAREIYRHNKGVLAPQKYSIIIVYVARELLTYQLMEVKLLRLFHRLKERKTK